jgi:hypothetical protein
MAIAVAKDVIKQLNSQKNPLCAGNYGYVASDYKFESDAGDLQKYVEEVQKANCRVCALGAALLSKARLFNHVPVKKISSKRYGTETFGIDVDNETVYKGLSSVFSKAQMQLIESAYERGNFGPESRRAKDEIIDAILFGDKYVDKKERLIAIMRNLIKNEGVFIPKPCTKEQRDEWRKEESSWD